MFNMQRSVHLNLTDMRSVTQLPPVHSVIEGLFTVYTSDMFLVSYPKSGNTWARFLIANLLAPDQEISFRNIDDFVFGWNKEWRQLESAKHPRFIKSHWRMFGHFPRFIYFFRDGRDALVSYYHFMKARNNYTISFSEFLDTYMGDKILLYGRWHEHVGEALIAASRRPDNHSLILKYEDMLVSPFEVAKDIAQFCNFTVTDAEIAAALEKCSFAKLQETEQKHGPEHLEKPYTFFRKGTSGQWKEMFSQSDLDKFYRVAGPMLEALGYSLER
jgi:hypothetical protein